MELCARLLCRLPAQSFVLWRLRDDASTALSAASRMPTHVTGTRAETSAGALACKKRQSSVRVRTSGNGARFNCVSRLLCRSLLSL